MSVSSKIIIIGAGPYGLSIAAHLRARGVAFRIFGRPMANWQEKMPRGMRLKSEGFASNLADPDDRYTLAAYCAHEGMPYEDEGLPVSRESFIDYGHAFQQRFVPEVEDRLVVSLHRSGDGFAVQLDDGEIVAADRIVVAIGISDFAYLPPVFAGLPVEFVSHVARHEDMAVFRGREVAVIGGGSSAIDIAALLHEAGAGVRSSTGCARRQPGSGRVGAAFSTRRRRSSFIRCRPICGCGSSAPGSARPADGTCASASSGGCHVFSATRRRAPILPRGACICA